MKHIKKVGKFSIRKSTVVKLNAKSLRGNLAWGGDTSTGDTTSVVTISHFN